MHALPLRFVTSNADKVRECSLVLQRPIEPIRLELDELQSLHLEQVVRRKAQDAFERARQPVFVEDTSLRFLAWGALPGPFIKHFLEQLGLPGILKALAPFADGRAEAACGIGYHDGLRVHYFEGRVPGQIGPPRGQGGFGWDPIFRPEGSVRSYAEMDVEEKLRISMRGLALRRFGEFLREQEALSRLEQSAPTR